jgi:membrane associated rhomboid family serine protease
LYYLVLCPDFIGGVSVPGAVGGVIGGVLVSGVLLIEKNKENKASVYNE